MNQDKLYRLSCRAAKELLEDLERGNFDQIEEKLAQIRHYVELAETVPAESLRGSALHHREQMELLAGITERLTTALAAVRQKISEEVQRFGSNRNLLHHLVASSSSEEPRCALPLPL